MNAQLQSQFTREEIQDALKQIAPLKAPRPDRFSACFYQSYLSIVGEEVSNAILAFLNDRFFDKSTNFTYIVLIPKVKNLITAKDFMPISLCSVTYKLAFKVLANRLKVLLPTIILNIKVFFP